MFIDSASELEWDTPLQNGDGLGTMPEESEEDELEQDEDEEQNETTQVVSNRMAPLSTISETSIDLLNT